MIVHQCPLVLMRICAVSLCLGRGTHAPCREMVSPCLSVTADILEPGRHTWTMHEQCSQGKHDCPDSCTLLAMVQSWIHSGCWAGLNTLSPPEAAALSCCAALTSLCAALQEWSLHMAGELNTHEAANHQVSQASQCLCSHTLLTSCILQISTAGGKHASHAIKLILVSQSLCLGCRCKQRKGLIPTLRA